MRRCETSGGARCAGLKAASSYLEGRVSVVVNMSIWICPKNRLLQAFLINVIFCQNCGISIKQMYCRKLDLRQRLDGGNWLKIPVKGWLPVPSTQSVEIFRFSSLNCRINLRLLSKDVQAAFSHLLSDLFWSCPPSPVFLHVIYPLVDSSWDLTVSCVS